MKATNVRNKCIVKIKTINEIQCIRIHKNYVVLLHMYIYFFTTSKNNKLAK